jgi:HprK-related kinase B
MIDISQQLLQDQQLIETSLDLDMSFCSCRIHLNSQALLTLLTDYFSAIAKPVSEPTYTITLIESDVAELAVSFSDWKREPGKTGRKDSFVDLSNARLIRKVRTGMVFLQSQQSLIAHGPCLENDNQVINFICSQMMTWLQQRDWLICHAASIVVDDHAVAIAGFSGGGKSTLMLTMLEQENTKFLTNDRLFVRVKNTEGVEVAGIPKMPRINPGTIVHNPRLHDLIEPAERARLSALPSHELWDIEQKFDVDIERFYGENRIQYQAPFKALLILNWSHSSDETLQLSKIDLAKRPELLNAVIKSPGPFYQQKNGQFIDDDYQANTELYLSVLAQVDVYEATGKVDIKELSERYLKTVS